MPISAFGQSVFNFVKSIHLLCKLVTRGSVFVFVNAAAFGAALWLFLTAVRGIATLTLPIADLRAHAVELGIIHSIFMLLLSSLGKSLIELRVDVAHRSADADEGLEPEPLVDSITVLNCFTEHVLAAGSLQGDAVVSGALADC